MTNRLGSRCLGDDGAVGWSLGSMHSIKYIQVLDGLHFVHDVLTRVPPLFPEWVLFGTQHSPHFPDKHPF